MIRSGLTARLAVDRVYHVYGRGTSVTIIINKLKQASQESQQSIRIIADAGDTNKHHHGEQHYRWVQF